MITPERGPRGPRGLHGKKGDTGDHGEKGNEPPAGDIGATGATGKTGPTGATGVAGKMGATGKSSPYLGRRQTLTLFAFIVLAFVLLAVRSEINAAHIRQGVYENCVTRAEAENVRSNCGRR